MQIIRPKDCDFMKNTFIVCYKMVFERYVFHSYDIRLNYRIKYNFVSRLTSYFLYYQQIEAKPYWNFGNMQKKEVIFDSVIVLGT